MKTKLVNMMSTYDFNMENPTNLRKKITRHKVHSKISTILEGEMQDIVLRDQISTQLQFIHQINPSIKKINVILFSQNITISFELKTNIIDL